MSCPDRNPIAQDLPLIVAPVLDLIVRVPLTLQHVKEMVPRLRVCTVHGQRPVGVAALEPRRAWLRPGGAIDEEVVSARVSSAARGT